MKNKTFLFPHKFQKVGCWILLLSFIGIPVSLFFCNVLGLIDFKNSFAITIRILAGLMAIFLSIGLFLIAFSQERFEDEYIGAIRKKSIIISTIIGFCCYLIYSTIASIGGACMVAEAFGVSGNIVDPDGFKMMLSDFCQKYKWLENFSGVFYMFIYYEVIFRINLHKLNKSVNNAE